MAQDTLPLLGTIHLVVIDHSYDLMHEAIRKRALPYQLARWVVAGDETVRTVTIDALHNLTGGTGHEPNILLGRQYSNLGIIHLADIDDWYNLIHEAIEKTTLSHQPASWGILGDDTIRTSATGDLYNLTEK